MSLVEDKKTDFEKPIQFLKNELSSIQTGRASPSLVENLMVDYYETKTPLIQLASITSPDAKLIIIQPWDKINPPGERRGCRVGNISSSRFLLLHSPM